ncbi:MAG: hypothetical protein VB042_08620 [Victivallaceae bacterium]|nr:hypothetical protein [Victivallaceae bacterium]
MNYTELIALARKIRKSLAVAKRAKKKLAKAVPTENPVFLEDPREQLNIIGRELVLHGKCPCCSICAETILSLIADGAKPEAIAHQIRKQQENEI